MAYDTHVHIGMPSERVPKTITNYVEMFGGKCVAYSPGIFLTCRSFQVLCLCKLHWNAWRLQSHQR